MANRPSPAASTDRVRVGTGFFAVRSSASSSRLASDCSRSRGSRSRDSAGSSGLTETWGSVVGEFGARPFIWGTLYSSVLALIISTPIALGIAIFISSCRRSFCNAAVFLTELLAAIPQSCRAVGHLRAGTVRAQAGGGDPDWMRATAVQRPPLASACSRPR